MDTDKVSVFYIGDEGLIALPFSRQRANRNAGPASALESGSKTVFLLLFSEVVVSRTCRATFPCVGPAELVVRHSSSVSYSLRRRRSTMGIIISLLGSTKCITYS